MAQSGFTPISLYYSSTVSQVPLAGNLAFGELAINILDGKLYFKNSVGAVTLLSSSAIASGAFTTLSYSTSFTGTASATITDNSTSSALRVTQTGTGNSLLVEDSANPDATPFVIDNIGRIVIGFTTPITTYYDPQTTFARTYKAQIQGNTNTTDAGLALTSWSTVAGPALFYGSSILLTRSKSGTIGTQGVVASGDALGALMFSGDDGTNFVGAASISAFVDGIPGTNDMPGRILFSTTADGAATPTERMRIDSAGLVQIGSTSGAYKLNVFSDTPLSLYSAAGTGQTTFTIVGNATLSTNHYFSTGSTITFGTNANGAGVTERFRVDSLGNFDIGTTTSTEKFNVGQGNAYILRTGGAKLRLADQNNEVSFESVPVSLSTDAIFKTSGVERMRIDATGNVGIGVTPSAWGSNYRAIESSANSSVAIAAANINGITFISNAYNDNTNYLYKTTGAAARYSINNNIYQWYNAPSGTAGTTITFTQAMTLDAAGNLGIGATGPAAKLDVLNTTASNTVGARFSVNSGGYSAQNLSGLQIYYNLSNGLAESTIVYGNTTNSFLAIGNHNGTSYAERMRIDAVGNVGIGITPSNLYTPGKVIQIGVAGGATIYGSSSTAAISQNINLDVSGNYLYATTGTALNYKQASGQHQWYIAPSGTAGAVITFTQAMTLDASGNLGLGVTPSAWNNSQKAIDINTIGCVRADTLTVGFNNNTYYSSGAVWVYKTTLAATRYEQNSGQHIWHTAPSGTAGTTATFTQAMTLDASGNLMVGGTSPLVTAAGRGNITINGSASSILNFGIGNVSAGYIFQTSSDFTVWNAVAGAMVFGTSNIERMRLDSTGKLWIGSNSAANVSVGNFVEISGATTAYANYSANTIRAAVTSTAIGYFTSLSTDVAAFTLSTLYHYYASQGTFGAGSAVTNQYGFFASTLNIGATNNYAFIAGDTAAVTAGKTAYGFYSNVNVASGGGTTYGFYAAGTALSVFNGPVTVASLNGGQLAGLRNRIINGAMLVSQRATTATVTAGTAVPTASTGYPCVDRFFVYSTGANVSVSQTGGTPVNSQRITATGVASVTAIGIGQRIESANSFDLSSKTCTLSAVLSNSLLTTITWTASYANGTDVFGTIGTPTKTQIATGTFTVTSTDTLYSVNISVPSAATTGIEILFTVGAQISGTFSVSNVQFEAGTIATPFERRPYGMELALCQRYYQKTYDDATAPATATRLGLVSTMSYSAAANYGGAFNFNAPMRAVPTFTYWDGAGNLSKVSYYAASAWVDNNAWLTILNLSTKGANASYSALISAATMIHYTLSAEL